MNGNEYVYEAVSDVPIGRALGNYVFLLALSAGFLYMGRSFTALKWGAGCCWRCKKATPVSPRPTSAAVAGPQAAASSPGAAEPQPAQGAATSQPAQGTGVALV